jgi:ribonuclease HI
VNFPGLLRDLYRHIKKELKLTHSATHVGAEGNELADRMAMLGVQRKEKQTATGSGKNRYFDAAEDASEVDK